MMPLAPALRTDHGEGEHAATRVLPFSRESGTPLQTQVVVLQHALRPIA